MDEDRWRSTGLTTCGSELVQLDATGHCPNLSAPDETVAAIREYLDRQ